MRISYFLASLSCILLCSHTGLAEDSISKLQSDLQQAEQRQDKVRAIALGKQLIPLLEAKGLLPQATEAALSLAFAVDHVENPDETIAAAANAARLVEAAHQGNMRPWDYMLQSQMAGIQVKNHIAAGRLTKAQDVQQTAWKCIAQAVKLETGKEWLPSQPIPRQISNTTLDILLRNVRYDVNLMCLVGRDVEAVELIRKVDASLPPLPQLPLTYRVQMLNDLANELKFLGYWKDCQAVLDQTISAAGTGPNSLSARFNKVYWKATQEGPDPELLTAAKALHAEVLKSDYAPSRRIINRLMAKMAYAYREAGFEIGDLEKIIAEAQAAGDVMEAIYARRDMAMMQADGEDFPKAEENLLTTLASLRAIGKKSGEPTVYREYGQLLVKSGRPLEGISMLREAIRLTKSFRWTQHLPNLLHALAQGQAAAGDVAGLRATLAELKSLLASGQLQPERGFRAMVAIALCQQALGHSAEAVATLKLTVKRGTADGLSKWDLEWAEKFPLNEVKLANPPKAPLAATTDLQPRQITSSLLANERARVRFTISNPSLETSSGLLKITGEHLTGTWNHPKGILNLEAAETNGASSLTEKITLLPGEEFLLIGDGLGAHDINLAWEPNTDAAQQSRWQIKPTLSDGCDVAITNASLAGHNPFYAVRLHHAFIRRAGAAETPVKLALRELVGRFLFELL